MELLSGLKMQVEVQVYGGLDAQDRRPVQVEVEPGASTGDIARQIGVSLKRVGMIVVDGRVRGWDDRVEAGQRVCFFPPLMGG